MEAPIYDEWMDGQGTTVTTSVEASAGLAAPDQFGLHVNIPVSSRVPTGFTLTVYHSQDGFRWFPKYRNQTTGVAIPQLNVTTAFTVNTLNVFSWTESWPAPPSMRFLQIQLVLTGPVGFRVTIFNTSRKRTVRPRSAKEECDACMASGDFPSHMRVLHALGPAELASLRRVIKSPTRAGPARQRELAGLGADTLAKLERSLNAAALQVLGGKD